MLAAALLLWAAGAAHSDAPLPLLCGGRVQLAVPAGWQLAPATDAGGVLRSDDPKVAPIEIVGWDVPRGGEPSASAAAAAQETLLFHTGPYARATAVDFQTASGITGLLVTGTVKGADGNLEEAVFAAFATQGRFYIVGTFVPAGTGAQAISGTFGEVVRGLSFVVPQLPKTPTPAIATAPALAPTPPPAEVVEIRPPVAPTPDPPAPVAPAPALPVAAAPEPPEALVRYESPLGFRLEHPVGWTVGVADGRIEIASPVGDGSASPGALAVIWPLNAVAADQDPVALVRHVLSSWKVTGAQAATLATRADGSNRAFATGVVTAGDSPRRLVASCETQGDSALLTLLLVRPEEAAASLPRLAAVLSSFTTGPWWTDEPQDGPKQTQWREPNGGLLRVPIPVGWKVRGGTQNYNGTWSVYLELTSTDPRRLSVIWQQPVVPLYRELTPVLRNLGWQEGDKYVANPGDQALRILSRLSPQDFLTRQWLPNGPLRLPGAVIDKVETVSEPPAMLSGPNLATVSALLRGSGEPEARERYCLVSTGDAPARIGANCWQAAVLQADAPPGALDEALSVLRTAIREAGSSGSGAGATAVQALLRGAQEALRCLPVPSRPAALAREVLPNLGPRGKGDLWLMPPQALAPWQEAARAWREDSRSAPDLIPELREESWK